MAAPLLSHLAAMLLPYLLLLPLFAQAAPNLAYPLSSQQPPVARVSKPFVFDLLPSTFNSSVLPTQNLTYSTSTLPSWLSWSTASLAFYGTPSASDVGERPITLIASDGTGSTTSNFTLIVSNYSVPAVHKSFLTQIADPSLRAFSSATALPGGTGVSVPPYWSFSLGWASDTFRLSHTEPTNGELYLGVHQRGYTSLPSWLRFDNSSYTFNGVAPASGTYTIVMTGTDFWGYTGAQTSFVIEVGQGEGVELPKGTNWTDAVGMSRMDLEYEVDLSGVLVGGKTVNSDTLQVGMGSKDYPWLSVDNAGKLSGVVPDLYLNGTVTSLSVPLSISTTNTTNTLSLTAWLSLDVMPYLFTSFAIPNITAAPGDSIYVDLSQYIRNTSTSSVTINVTVSPSEAAQWLVYHSSNMTLTGQVPSTATYNDISVVFSATVTPTATTASNSIAKRATTDSAYTASASLSIGLPSVTNPSQPSGTASVPTDSSKSSAGKTLSKGAVIALAVCLGLLGLVILGLILFFCCRKRRSSDDEPKKTREDDADSFVAGPRSPVAQDPFRRSNTLDPPKQNLNLLGEIARFSGLHLRHGSEGGNTQRHSIGTEATTAVGTASEKEATRLGGLKGIFGWNSPGQESRTMEKDEQDINQITTPRMHGAGNDSASFLGHPEFVGVVGGIQPVHGGVGRPSQDASEFTQDFTSDEDSSRASWESRGSFRWSSAEGGSGEIETPRRRDPRFSTAESIPRPRDDFTPRYPRNNSPTALARLTSGRGLDQSPEFSEFASEEDHSMSIGSGSGNRLSSGFSHAGSSFPGGPSGLSRFGGGEGSGFKSIDEEEDEDAMSHEEGPAVVSMAERQSFETRRPRRTVSNPKGQIQLRPSRERVTSPTQTPPSQRSRRALADDDQDGMFSDAEEARRSMAAYGSGTGGVNGLGYPADSIFFGSQRGSTITEAEDAKRQSTITAIPTRENPLSPPLPQVGSFMRHRRNASSQDNRTSMAASGPRSRPTSSVVGDGRVVACANETFSIHPQINPPPTVSLSAATWSSAPPSTYRAEVEGGGALPDWLHFDNRQLELWGVPKSGDTGRTWNVRIIERVPSRRGGDPASFGYEGPQEREVGRVIVEVLDRLKSPQFALEGSPHAF